MQRENTETEMGFNCLGNSFHLKNICILTRTHTHTHTLHRSVLFLCTTLLFSMNSKRRERSLSLSSPSSPCYVSFDVTSFFLLLLCGLLFPNCQLSILSPRPLSSLPRRKLPSSQKLIHKFRWQKVIFILTLLPSLSFVRVLSMSGVWPKVNVVIPHDF